MDDFERNRVSEFRVRFPNYCEDKSDDQILLCLKFIEAGNKLIKDKIDEDIGKDDPDSLSVIITKLLRNIVNILESDIRPIANLGADTRYKGLPSYGHLSEDERPMRNTVPTQAIISNGS